MKTEEIKAIEVAGIKRELRREISSSARSIVLDCESEFTKHENISQKAERMLILIGLLEKMGK